MGQEARATSRGDERVGRDCLRQRLWQLFAFCLRRIVSTDIFISIKQRNTSPAQLDHTASASLPDGESPSPTEDDDEEAPPNSYPPTSAPALAKAKAPRAASITMALDNYYHNKIESMKLEILKGQAVLRRLEAQRNDYNSRVRLLREELGLLQQPGSYVGEVVKVMSTKKVLVKVHPEGKYGMCFICICRNPNEPQ